MCCTEVPEQQKEAVGRRLGKTGPRAIEECGLGAAEGSPDVRSSFLI